MDKETKIPDSAETAIAQDPVYQYSLFLENRVGALADVVRLLNEAGVDVLGLSLLDSIDLTVARMVLSDPDTAKPLLFEKGISFAEVELVVVEVEVAGEVDAGSAVIVNEVAKMFNECSRRVDAGVGVEVGVDDCEMSVGSVACDGVDAAGVEDVVGNIVESGRKAF